MIVERCDAVSPSRVIIPGLPDEVGKVTGSTMLHKPGIED
jgi:hypothetical protein